ncbi:MAG: Gfo/Idh/MocA family oxidoreductase [Rubrobacteraceae bacterium]|nr:Gfo/Idh/MocA family oxidoreductase [Rubrobacteraceae bacterium]
MAVRVGVIGCGKISGIYLENESIFDDIEVVACSDLLLERAEAQAEAYGVPRACTPEELLADEEVEIVLNLTVPVVHAKVSMAALGAGKHVYTEKPLAVDREDGQRMLEMAGERDLRVGCAPDTFLGGGLQTCRKVIDEGLIGEPVAVTALMMNHGPEDWHPNPDFFYQPGAGPMFDLGPYYLSTLATLMGPVRRVTGSARVTFPERKISSQPRAGTSITVNTPTHVAGVMDFEGGAVGTLVTTFDVWSEHQSRIDLYGTEGTLSLPDPNTFGGPVRLWRSDENAWTEVPLTHPYTGNSRGLGLADMAKALRSGRAHRASGELGMHVLDVIHAFLDSSERGEHVEVASHFERPEALPAKAPEAIFGGGA